MSKSLDLFLFVVFILVLFVAIVRGSSNENSPSAKCARAGGTWKHVGGVGVAKYNSICEMPKGK